eukprot:5842283-Amphidinium_carterae.1
MDQKTKLIEEAVVSRDSLREDLVHDSDALKTRIVKSLFSVVLCGTEVAICCARADGTWPPYWASPWRLTSALFEFGRGEFAAGTAR